MTVTAVLLLVVTVGCGEAELERRLQKQVDAMEQGSTFTQDMQEASVIPGTSVSVQLPKTIDATLLTDVDEKRLKPIGVDITGLKLTYEGTIADADEGEQPYYLYVGVIDIGALRKGYSGVNDFTRNKLMGTYTGDKGETGSWAVVQCETPAGRLVDWQKLRATGEQDFYYVDKDGNGDFLSMPGTLEVYTSEQNGKVITIAWRMPTSLEQSVAAFRMATKVAGSVVVEAE